MILNHVFNFLYKKGAGFKFVKIEHKKDRKYKSFLTVFGYELQATRLRAAAAKRDNQSSTQSSKTSDDLAALTEEMDQLATQTIGKYILLPMVLSYTFYTLTYEEHFSWYSWLITSASTGVYALGFVFMTPQLFLNYKLKSVAHLPWRVLCYRFINTFIDDLFAFIIRMVSTLHIHGIQNHNPTLMYNNVS